MRFLNNVTIWRPTGTDGFGNKTFAMPEIIMCKWEDKYQLFIDPAKSQEELSRAVVYTDDVDVMIDGYLFLGVSNNANPKDVVGAFRIRSVGKVRAVSSNKRVLVKIWL